MEYEYSFEDLECISCAYLVTVGNLMTENRYCSNFAHGKTKHFVTSDPKHKAPGWCPRRISPMIRIYRPRDGHPAEHERQRREDYAKKGGKYFHAWASNYALIYENAAAMTAQEFYQKFVAGQEDIWFEIGEFLVNGDIIEFDTGLSAYQFCLISLGAIAVVGSFHPDD